MSDVACNAAEVSVAVSCDVNLSTQGLHSEPNVAYDRESLLCFRGRALNDELTREQLQSLPGLPEAVSAVVLAVAKPITDPNKLRKVPWQHISLC